MFVFQSTNEAVLAVDFSPTDTNNIISCGKSHVYFWIMSAGTLTKKQGIFGVSLYLALSWLSSTVNLVSFMKWEEIIWINSNSLTKMDYGITIF